jgi:hypothetical protein
MDISNELYGFYRALVVGNRDPKFYGRITVWIPQIMPEVEPTRGLLASPANNPVGGRNMEGDEEHHYMGSSFIPKKGSWVFVFFEAGNPSNPYYFGSCDLENTTVLPECKTGSNPEDKWVILKSHQGRTIMMSDDPDDARVEITGKKRLIKEPPSGDVTSVTKIDDNQTTILLDEREKREKILIRTYKGDYIHIDIDQQNLQIDFKNDININCGGKFSLNVKKDIHIKGQNINTEAVLSNNRKAGLSIIDGAGVGHHTKAGSIIARDAGVINDNTGSSSSVEKANPTVPAGKRDT